MDFLRPKIFWLFLFLLPTQLGRHFWPDWAQILGLRIDYLAPTIYLTDLLIFTLFLLSLPRILNVFKTNICSFWLWIPVIIFFWLTVGILMSSNPQTGFYKLIKFSQMIFLAVYISRTVRNNSSFQKLLTPLSPGLIFESLLAIAQFLKQGSIGGIFWWLGERTFFGQTPGIAQAE